jgi:hypothetical protein
MTPAVWEQLGNAQSQHRSTVRRLQRRRRVQLAIVLSTVVIGAIGWVLFAATLLISSPRPASELPRPGPTVALDRVATLLMDESDDSGGLLSGAILESRQALGTIQLRVRLENRTGGDIALGQADFTMPDAMPPIGVADPALPDTLPPGVAIEMTLTFTGNGQALLWCPSARPGTCIRL